MSEVRYRIIDYNIYENNPKGILCWRKKSMKVLKQFLTMDTFRNLIALI